MSTLRLIFGLFCLALVLYVVGTVAWQYYKHPELSGWARWRHVANDSATLLFNKLAIVLGAIIGGISQFVEFIGSLLGDPNLKTELNSWFEANHIDPKIIATIVLSLTLGYYLTRMRSISKAD
jgi:hypothetical protein